jgi:hypothetical protein
MEITFQVLEGFDKGRIFRDLDSPVSIGREDGNTLRLNDERVSRYHAKVNRDRDHVILVDLDSTNGTRINGQVCSMRCLLPADIQKRLEDLCQPPTSDGAGQALNPANSKETEYSPKAGEARFPAPWGGETVPAEGPWKDFSPDKISSAGGRVFSASNALPALPEKLSPLQAARLAEMLDFLHWNLSLSTGGAVAMDGDGAKGSRMDFQSMQRLLAVQMALARYTLALADPAVQ